MSGGGVGGISMDGDWIVYISAGSTVVAGRGWPSGPLSGESPST